jgi:hypothetical protein
MTETEREPGPTCWKGSVSLPSHCAVPKPPWGKSPLTLYERDGVIVLSARNGRNESRQTFPVSCLARQVRRRHNFGLDNFPYCSVAYSAFACSRTGTSGSAFFQRLRKSDERRVIRGPSFSALKYWRGGEYLCRHASLAGDQGTSPSGRQQSPINREAVCQVAEFPVPLHPIRISDLWSHYVIGICPRMGRRGLDVTRITDRPSARAKICASILRGREKVLWFLLAGGTCA